MARKKFYCIDYRNMHTAIHGLIVYDSRKQAEDAYELLRKNIREFGFNGMDEEQTYQEILNIAFNSSIDCIDEIDFRKIKEKQLYGRLQKVYNDDYIIVNFCSIDLYLYL